MSDRIEQVRKIGESLKKGGGYLHDAAYIDFMLGAETYRTLTAEQWKREREAISRTVDPLAWRNVDHFMADGKDLRFCWPWIKTPLRRADDVLWLLGFTRADAESA